MHSPISSVGEVGTHTAHLAWGGCHPVAADDVSVAEVRVGDESSVGEHRQLATDLIYLL